MLEVDPGHLYEMQTIDGVTEQNLLRFVKRVGKGYPGNEEPAYAGTNIQDVCRCLIARLIYLNRQIPFWGNRISVYALRVIINLLELRAAQRHGRPFRWVWYIELMPTEKDGHIRY